MHLVHLRSTLRTPAVTLQPGRNAPAMEKVPAPRQTNQLLPGLEIGEAHRALRPAAANDRSPARFEHDVGERAEGSQGEPLGDGSAGGGWVANPRVVVRVGCGRCGGGGGGGMGIRVSGFARARDDAGCPPIRSLCVVSAAPLADGDERSGPTSSGSVFGESTPGAEISPIGFPLGAHGGIRRVVPIVARVVGARRDPRFVHGDGIVAVEVVEIVVDAVARGGIARRRRARARRARGCRRRFVERVKVTVAVSGRPTVDAVRVATPTPRVARVRALHREPAVAPVHRREHSRARRTTSTADVASTRCDARGPARATFPFRSDAR